MEKVVISLGGSVLVPGDDDARYLRTLAALLRDVSSRVKLFVVTGGGRIARYYIETGRALGIGERTLDEFGIAVTRLNARLLAAALGGRANREPATTYAEAAKLSRRHSSVLKTDPSARLIERMRFENLVRVAGSGHAAAGPSIVFDPVAARVLARDRTPLGVVHGGDLRALRAAILGEPFHGTLVTD